MPIDLIRRREAAIGTEEKAIIVIATSQVVDTEPGKPLRAVHLRECSTALAATPTERALVSRLQSVLTCLMFSHW